MENWTDTLLVNEMDDGGMGSLKLAPSGTLFQNARFGRMAGDCMFKDSDGIDVIASLYVDKNNQLFELDLWKVDFTKLIYIPELFLEVNALP